MRIRISDIKVKAANRPSGYQEDILANGKVHGEFLIISWQAYQHLYRKYNQKNPVKPKCCNGGSLPPMTTQFANAGKALGRIVKTVSLGKSIWVTEDVLIKRKAVCAECQHWIVERRRCSVCGCSTDFKLKLNTERCPKGFW